MQKQTFQLTEGQEYIQLNNLLKTLSIAQTGGHAKLIIQNGEVLVNNEVETRVRKKLFSSDIVVIGNVVIDVK